MYRPYPFERMVKEKHLFLPSKPEPYGTILELVSNEIRPFLHTYIDCPPEFEALDSWYIPFTWVYDLYPILPYRRALGHWGTGKTRWAQTVGVLCRLSYVQGACANPAPLYRMCDIMQGTQIIDETEFSKNTEVGMALSQILNSGYSRFSGSVIRCIGRENVPTPFNTYAPRLIAARRGFSDNATESRTISHTSYEVERDDLPTVLGDEFWEKALRIRNKLFRWQLGQLTKPVVYDEEFTHRRMNARLKEIFLPLVSIIQEQKPREKLIEEVMRLNNEIVDAGQERFEASIVKTIIASWFAEVSLRMKDIAQRVRELEGIQDEKQLSPRKCGWYCKKVLQLKTGRAPTNPRPIEVKQEPTNFERLRRLVKRYGITKEEVQYLKQEYLAEKKVEAERNELFEKKA